jgi:hypothetical protein
VSKSENSPEQRDRKQNFRKTVCTENVKSFLYWMNSAYSTVGDVVWILGLCQIRAGVLFITAYLWWYFLHVDKYRSFRHFWKLKSHKVRESDLKRKRRTFSVFLFVEVAWHWVCDKEKAENIMLEKKLVDLSNCRFWIKELVRFRSSSWKWNPTS